MSHKEHEDKSKPGYPWTARQLRRVKRRLQRKQDRKLARNL